MQTTLRKVLSFSILLICLLWIGLYIRNNPSDFSGIRELSAGVVAILAVVLIIDTIILGLFNKVLMDHLEVPLKFKEWYGLSIVSNLWNYILPFRGGAGIRALYLKKVQLFSVSDFLGTMLALYFISFLVNSFIGLFCVFTIYFKYTVIHIPISFFFGVVFILMGGSIFLSPKIPYAKNWFLEKVFSVLRSWDNIRKEGDLIARLILVVVVHAVLELLTVYASFAAYSIQASLIQCLFISTIFSFSVLLKITPGSLGITEALMVIGANTFGITPGQSLLAAGLIRAVNMCLIFLIAPIFNYRLMYDFRMARSASG
jgi:uncharacterized membrane protein YbhN (UPF0104 family)